MQAWSPIYAYFSRFEEEIRARNRTGFRELRSDHGTNSQELAIEPTFCYDNHRQLEEMAAIDWDLIFSSLIIQRFHLDW